MTYTQSIGHHITALERAVEQISGQFLQQSSPRAKRNVFDAPSVLFHAFHNLFQYKMSFLKGFIDHMTVLTYCKLGVHTSCKVLMSTPSP